MKATPATAFCLNRRISARYRVISVWILLSFLLPGLPSCTSSDSDTPDPVIILKKNKPVKGDSAVSAGTPIINLSDTSVPPEFLITLKDSAIDNVRLSQKLARLYGEKLPRAIGQMKLKITGPPRAWYRSQKAPFFFEAGFPVDRKPGKPPKGFLVKKLPGGRVIRAHFYGPYEETTQAYDVIRDWLKDQHRMSNGSFYEEYVDNPIGADGKPMDPYKVKTDIVMPYR